MVDARRSGGQRPARVFDPRRLGAFGEQRAAEWYEAEGYRVVARNWRCRRGEIDLILAVDDLIVFCEVKTRSSDRYGTPFEAVGPEKQHRLRVLAAQWLEEESPRTHRRIRFDVAGVVGGTVHVRESAF